MSIPRFEPLSAFEQMEFWAFDRDRDGSSTGLYCQQYSPPYIERLFTRLDRAADRREAALRVRTFDRELESLSQHTTQGHIERILIRQSGRRRPVGAIWIDDNPNLPQFAEICSTPRPRIVRQMVFEFMVR